jgi:hypothetical protein
VETGFVCIAALLIAGALMSQKISLSRMMFMMQRFSLRQVSPAIFLLTLVVAWNAIASAAQAFTVKFTKVAESGDPAPGTDKILGRLSTPPGIDGAKVVFTGVFATGRQGDTVSEVVIYKFSNGTLQKQLDRDTIVPRSNHERFGNLRIGETFIQNDRVIVSTYAYLGLAYSSLGIPVPQIKGGIYSIKNGQFNVIADTETIEPSTGQKFSEFGLDGLRVTNPVSYGMSASDDQVVFVAATSLEQTKRFGLRLFRNGNLSTLIGESTINPVNGQPLGQPSFFTNVIERIFIPSKFEINGRQIVYAPVEQSVPPAGSGKGIFAVMPQRLIPIVSIQDKVPGTNENLQLSGDLSVNRQGTLAFSNAGKQILLKRQNRLKTLYQVGQAVPGLRTPPIAVSNPCISGDQVAFVATLNNTPPQNALLVSRNNKISVLLQTGDQLNGKTVDSIAVSPRFCSGRFFAFAVRFDPTLGTSGIYRGEILPNPQDLAAGQKDESEE